MGQDLPALTMRETESGMFDFADEDMVSRSLFECGLHQLRRKDQVHDVADVMQQSSQVSLIRIFEAHATRQLPAQHGYAEGVLPENGRIKSVLRCSDVHDRAGDGDVPGAGDAQCADGAANRVAQFPRTVRDVALGCGKQVNIEMEGKETELDKTIIEAIKDPLTHLVRNSVDHGIELPEDRVKAGKDPTGRLILRAFHEGGQVNIEITDDGAGLNRERIRQKAVERGMVTSDQAARLSEREIFNLIFLPGFSTAQKVTNVSGRGVGMDVVKTNVEKIGGVVDVQSTPGQGTTVRVKIPLTLAIIPALVVTCGGDRYAIPQVSLLELVRLEAEQARSGIEMVHGVPVHRLRGRLLPLVYLSRELQLASGKKRDGATSTADSHSNWETIHFSQARTKHQQWLGRLRDALDGKTTITTKEAGSHTGCAFGKWLYSAGLKNYGDLPEIHAVVLWHLANTQLALFSVH